MLLQLFEKNFFYRSILSVSLYSVASIFAISRKCIMRHFDDQCCVHGHASILGMHNSSQPISLASIFFSYISLTFLPHLFLLCHRYFFRCSLETIGQFFSLHQDFAVAIPALLIRELTE